MNTSRVLVNTSHTNLLWKWARSKSKWIIDSNSWLKTEPILNLIMRTLRYRFAGNGIAITRNERNLVSYHNKHRGQRAFIIGNGPSLNKCNLTLLQKEITFGVNSIFLNYDKMGFHPTYYVVEDTFVAEDRADQIITYKGPTKFFGNYLRYCIDDSPDTIWLNVLVRYDKYSGFPLFSYNAARKVWVGGTVTYICLQLAFYMGFSEVYLIGFDHNYRIPSDSILVNVYKSGADILSTNDDPNHFHPDYFGKGYRWHDPRVDRMELAYIRAKEVYESEGRIIHNATVGGKLEVFERVNYDDLF